MKRSLAAALIVVSCVAAFAQQNECVRHVEKEGKFSLCPPSGWIARDEAGEKFKMFFAPQARGMTANLNVKAETNKLPLHDYVSVSVNYLLDNFQSTGATSAKLVSRSDLVTEGGQKATKVVFLIEYKGSFISIVQYCIATRQSEKVILTFTTPKSYKAANETVFDRSAKTFRMEQ